MKMIALFFGILFGAILVGARVTSYNIIHESLLLHSPYLFLLMGSAMLVGLFLILLMEKVHWNTPLNGELQIKRKKMERKHIFGGIVFGFGWAITGTCPAVSAAQLGIGMLTGLIVMVGLFLGTLLHDVIANSQTIQPVSDEAQKDIKLITVRVKRRS